MHCKALGTFCPYFSIEFKANLESTRIVVNQVVAAGPVSLFNRYQLKLHAYPHPNQEQFELVRHFGLTMEKEKWIVWHFVPKTVVEVQGRAVAENMKEMWCGCLSARSKPTL